MKMKYLIHEKENGVTSIEYALLASFIAVIILVSVGSVGRQVRALYESVAAGFN